MGVQVSGLPKFIVKQFSALAHILGMAALDNCSFIKNVISGAETQDGIIDRVFLI